MTIRTIWVKGEVPYTKNFGTLAELLALVPSTEFAEGFASDYGRIDWSKGAGRWMSGGKLLSADGPTSFAWPVAAPNSISSFLPGQTEGVPDTAALVVNAGTSQVLTLPTGTAFRLDWAGFGPFAFRFGSSSAVAVATDFPGVVGLPQYFEKPAGATHIAVYGIGGGTLVVSGGSRP